MNIGNSLAAQWLRLFVLTAEGLSSISGQGTKIPQASRWGKKKKKKKERAEARGGCRWKEVKKQNKTVKEHTALHTLKQLR